MRIALVAPLVAPLREPQLGGVQTFLVDLARGLAGRGHDVTVFAARGSRVDGVRVVDTGVDPALLGATLFRPGRRDPDRDAGGTAGGTEEDAAAAAAETAAAAAAFAATIALGNRQGGDPEGQPHLLDPLDGDCPFAVRCPEVDQCSHGSGVLVSRWSIMRISSPIW
jgi:hypothetical protein